MTDPGPGAEELVGGKTGKALPSGAKEIRHGAVEEVEGLETNAYTCLWSFQARGRVEHLQGQPEVPSAGLGCTATLFHTKYNKKDLLLFWWPAKCNHVLEILILPLPAKCWDYNTVTSHPVTNFNLPPCLLT